jgi:hypothetical protein
MVNLFKNKDLIELAKNVSIISCPINKTKAGYDVGLTFSVVVTDFH